MKKMKKFLTDFRDFITKGNILAMAVGVIIGGAFKGIINVLVKNILMPVVTLAIPGGLDGLVTVLNESEASIVGAVPDGVNTVSYYGTVYNADIVNVINWGTFINELINFIIIAFVLFIIIRSVMMLNMKRQELKEISSAFTVDEQKALRENGKSLKEIIDLAKEKVAQEKIAKEAAEKAKAAAKESELSVLKDIKTLLENQAGK